MSTPQPSTMSNVDEDDIDACFSDDDCCEFEFVNSGNGNEENDDSQ